MTEETAAQLVGCLTEVFLAVADCQKKLVALENAMKKGDPALVKLWSNEIESLRNLKAYQIDLSAISNLNTRLRQSE